MALGISSVRKDQGEPPQVVGGVKQRQKERCLFLRRRSETNTSRTPHSWTLSTRKSTLFARRDVSPKVLFQGFNPRVSYKQRHKGEVSNLQKQKRRKVDTSQTVSYQLDRKSTLLARRDVSPKVLFRESGGLRYK